MSEEITAEFSTEELTQAPAELRVRPKISLACKTDLGRVRENNEDKFEFYIPEDDYRLATRGAVFVVCDGMGGHAAGQIASELSCKTFIDVYMNHTAPEIEKAARAAIEAANRYILDMSRQIPSRSGMGTTLSALVICQDRGTIAHVGDSRIYRLRHGVLEQLTEDHTLVNEQIKAGLLSPEQAMWHPYSHVLSRAIGVEENIEPQIETFDLEENDIYLLCTDGLTNHVPDEEIRNILANHSLSEAAWRLVNSALTEGGRDNCTVLIVRVDELTEVGKG
ncbi:MAG TPA: Stp1/IreP family PP2C-type Ser/Thr phosphatase [Fimbriimonadales bacterium]|nr:Stp1/IreP family PP2C-type Ser/Thr phosphatase [Fimbriimonadales bacterium]